MVLATEKWLKSSDEQKIETTVNLPTIPLGFGSDVETNLVTSEAGTTVSNPAASTSQTNSISNTSLILSNTPSSETLVNVDTNEIPEKVSNQTETVFSKKSPAANVVDLQQDPQANQAVLSIINTNLKLNTLKKSDGGKNNDIFINQSFRSNQKKNGAVDLLDNRNFNGKSEELLNQSSTGSFSRPITPQALSSALKTVMNTPNNGGTLQNNYINTIGLLDMSNNAVLDQTAKQINSSICNLDITQTNLANINNVSSVGSGFGNGSSLQDNISSAPTEALDESGEAKIVLLCEANSHPFMTRTIPLTPNIECKVGRLIAKSKAAESNAIFDCKVLSRNHAVLWYSDDGKFWVKDTKSSNGTFINENKLGTEASELHFGDIVKFGVDVMENSRKEVHGCIIACVRLYLPDGREAISIDSDSVRSQYSGEGKISFDELHRLNLYMQEASQREKVLKSKLFNIQNILDATRKNSTMCWQSMINEDQLLHRINSLEKKIQIMEKNLPESALRNEVLKLLDDRSAYQNTAKEAIRKVYNERCEALQMLTKVEGAYTTSENECKVLREQVMNTKQSLQDVSSRLQLLEAEYISYKEETERQSIEAKAFEEQRAEEVLQKLNDRESECDELRKKITELMSLRAELLEEEQKQAIEKLDAAIGELDVGEDYVDDEDDDDDDEEEEDEQDHSRNLDIIRAVIKRDSSNESKTNLLVNGSDIEQNKENTSTSSKSKKSLGKQTIRKVGKKSTIMKWLENSDLNTKEGSIDIFKAICKSDSESSDENETTSRSGANADNFYELSEDLEQKLENFQKNLEQLEVHITEQANKSAEMMANSVQGSTHSNEGGDNETENDENKKVENNMIAKEDSNFLLLKSSALMLREAFSEVCENIKMNQRLCIKNKSTQPPANSVVTQFQNVTHKAGMRLETQETLKPLAESNEEDHDSDDDECDDDDDISDATRLSISSRNTVKETDITQKIQNVETELKLKHEKELHLAQQEIEELKQKLEQCENEAQHTLEIQQIECDSFKDKVDELTQLIEVLKRAEESIDKSLIEANDVKLSETATEKKHCSISKKKKRNSVSSSNSADIKEITNIFEEQTAEELKALNSSIVQREEELIMYKERLEEIQTQNLQLRKDIMLWQIKAKEHTRSLILRMVPFAVIFLGCISYFLLHHLSY